MYNRSREGLQHLQIIVPHKQLPQLTYPPRLLQNLHNVGNLTDFPDISDTTDWKFLHRKLRPDPDNRKTVDKTRSLALPLARTSSRANCETRAKFKSLAPSITRKKDINQHSNYSSLCDIVKYFLINLLTRRFADRRENWASKRPKKNVSDLI